MGGALLTSPLSPPHSVLIRFISNPTAPSWWGFLVAGLMFLCSMMQSLILQQYYQCIFVTGLKFRTGIIGVIYRKVSWSKTQGRGWPWAACKRLAAKSTHLLSTCRLWLSPIQSNVRPPWGKLSTSCQWMPSASWTLPPSSTCCGQHPCRSSWRSTSSGR